MRQKTSFPATNRIFPANVLGPRRVSRPVGAEEARAVGLQKKTVKTFSPPKFNIPSRPLPGHPFFSMQAILYLQRGEKHKRQLNLNHLLCFRSGSRD